MGGDRFFLKLMFSPKTPLKIKRLFQGQNFLIYARSATMPVLQSAGQLYKMLPDGQPYTFWIVLCHGNDGLLRAGKPQSLVRARFRWNLHTGINLWVPARRMAVWHC
jgi:hypothetical protein